MRVGNCHCRWVKQAARINSRVEAAETGVREVGAILATGRPSLQGLDDGSL